MSGDDRAPSLRNSLETEITLSRMAVADASLEFAESSDSTGATAEFVISGAGEQSIPSSTVSKKWLMAVICLQSHTLSQSAQSQDLLHSLTR